MDRLGSESSFMGLISDLREAVAARDCEQLCVQSPLGSSVTALLRVPRIVRDRWPSSGTAKPARRAASGET